MNASIQGKLRYITVNNQRVNSKCIFSFLLLVTLSLLPQIIFGAENNFKGGLLPPTPAEIELQDKYFIRPVKIRMNSLALERINSQRLAKRLAPLSIPATDIAPIGHEIEGVTGKSGLSKGMAGVSAFAALPLSVDNSQLPAFPVVGHQGTSGACAAWAATYYMFTHEMSLLKGWNNKTLNYNTCFSPKWTYNFVNNGNDAGSTYYANYEILRAHGGATWSEFPFDPDSPFDWCLKPQVYRNALSRRINERGILTTQEIGSSDAMKSILANGHLINISCWVSGWQYRTVQDDPSITSDNAFVGERIVLWAATSTSSHAMTIVGYNDELWLDINANGRVDAGEKGAWKVVNSYGTSYCNNGFVWVAYDAVFPLTKVANGPTNPNRQPAFWPDAFFLTVRENYQPKLIARTTLNFVKRNNLKLYTGFSDMESGAPERSVYQPAFVAAGGQWAFDGSGIPCDLTVYVDMTDVIPGVTRVYRYYLTMDQYDGDYGQDWMKDFVLIDVAHGNIETAATNVPILAQGFPYASGIVEYQYDVNTTFTITASAGTGGTISPSGAQTVALGTSKAFAIAPSPGYTISQVIVDGTNWGAISSYTFTNITSNHSIAASFIASDGKTVNCIATKDAFTRDGNYATLNYGTTTTLASKVGSTGYNRKTYMTFDVSGAKSCQSATLKWFVNQMGTSGAFYVDVDKIETPWNESTITWNNAPTTIAQHITTSKLVSATGWQELDISSVVKSEISSGDKIFTLCFVALGGADYAMYTTSKEATNKPMITVIENSTSGNDTIAAVKDSYVRNGTYATANYGTATTMMTKLGSTGYCRKTIMGFDVSARSTCTSAKLRWYVNQMGTSGAVTLDVDKIETTWSETGITWNNFPTTVSQHITTSKVVSTTGWQELDITSLVKNEMSGGDKKFSIAITSISSGSDYAIYMRSRENTNKPQIVLTGAAAKKDVIEPMVSMSRANAPDFKVNAGMIVFFSEVDRELSIVNLMGRTVLSKRISANETFAVPQSKLAQGTYFLSMIDDKRRLVCKKITVSGR